MDKPLSSLCTDWSVKWYYNVEKEVCDRFWFGGCDTVSRNIFDNEEQCGKSCNKMVEEGRKEFVLLLCMINTVLNLSKLKNLPIPNCSGKELF